MCDVPVDERLEYVFDYMHADECIYNGCCWDSETPVNIFEHHTPYCYIPQYKVEDGFERSNIFCFTQTFTNLIKYIAWKKMELPYLSYLSPN